MGVINLGILIRKLSHVFLRKDEAATELSTLGFVKNTDYAGASTGGVIKISTSNGSSVTSSGVIIPSTLTGTQYTSAPNQTFIGKATLENAKADITARSLVDIAQTQFAEPTTGYYTVKLAYDGTNWGVIISKDT